MLQSKMGKFEGKNPLFIILLKGICPFLSPTFYLYLSISLSLSSIFRLFEDDFENFWFTVLLKGKKLFDFACCHRVLSSHFMTLV